MPKFQKKPVVIDAWLWDETKSTFEALKAAGMTCGHYDSHLTEDFVRNMRIQTLEGSMFADKGDMIIKGVKGEFYPCKPDIFEATYSAVEDVPASNMPPHQQRVIDEKCQLDTRLQALRKFISTGDVFETLHENEQQRMRHQVDAMSQYLSILAERIESFPIG